MRWRFHRTITILREHRMKKSLYITFAPTDAEKNNVTTKALALYRIKFVRPDRDIGQYTICEYRESWRGPHLTVYFTLDLMRIEFHAYDPDSVVVEHILRSLTIRRINDRIIFHEDMYENAETNASPSSYLWPSLVPYRSKIVDFCSREAKAKLDNTIVDRLTDEQYRFRYPDTGLRSKEHESDHARGHYSNTRTVPLQITFISND